MRNFSRNIHISREVFCRGLYKKTGRLVYCEKKVGYKMKNYLSDSLEDFSKSIVIAVLNDHRRYLELGKPTNMELDLMRKMKQLTSH